MSVQENRDSGLSETKPEAVSPTNAITRLAGAATLIAMLALGATGATAVLATAVVLGLIGFAVSRLAVRRFRGEGKPALDSDFRGFTGQLR